MAQAGAGADSRDDEDRRPHPKISKTDLHHQPSKLPPPRPPHPPATMAAQKFAPFSLGRKAVYLYAPTPLNRTRTRTRRSTRAHRPRPLRRTTAAAPTTANPPPRTHSPDFALTLLRTPFLPPTFAKFLVPLHFNKLDLRDYLWHAYGVRCTNIRSFVQQQKMRQDDHSRKRPMPRRWYRGPAIKKMTVEMDKPFMWPEEPEDWTEYVFFLLRLPSSHACCWLGGGGFLGCLGRPGNGGRRK